jgi:hypothetical protein
MAWTSDRSKIENKENNTLIWFDPNIDEKVDRVVTMKTLRAINDYVIVYTNMEQCIAYIESVRNEKVFLVTSGTWASLILPSVIDLKQVEGIYIFCTKREQHLYLIEKYPKILGVFIDQKELALNIRKNLYLLNKQVETFSFYDQNQKVSMNLSERTAAFLW